MLSIDDSIRQMHSLSGDARIKPSAAYFTRDETICNEPTKMMHLSEHAFAIVGRGFLACVSSGVVTNSVPECNAFWNRPLYHWAGLGWVKHQISETAVEPKIPVDGFSISTDLTCHAGSTQAAQVKLDRDCAATTVGLHVMSAALNASCSVPRWPDNVEAITRELRSVSMLIHYSRARWAMKECCGFAVKPSTYLVVALKH